MRHEDDEPYWLTTPPEDHGSYPDWPRGAEDAPSPAAGAAAEGQDVLEQILKMLTQVSATQQSQQQGLNALNEAVQNQQSAIEAQQKEMDDLQASLAAAPDGPFAWAELRGLEREMLWRRLYDWVTWLEDRYLRNLSVARQGIPALHADWYRHPVAVEMLTALMVAHFAAYREKAAPPSFALVDWHERALWPTLARMEALGLFKREDEEKDWDGPEARNTRRDSSRFYGWLDADVEAHPEEK